MKRKLREQGQEQMDPKLRAKLKDPSSLYATNPAMKKGAKDVERLVTQRFQKVVDKLKQVTGIEDLSSQQVQGMIYQEMMSKLPMIVNIEGRHKDELEQLAIEVCLDETETPEDWYKIIAELNRGGIDTSNFKFKPKEEKEEKPKLEIPSFDVEDLTDEEIFELEKHKRNIINAIIQGAAKKGHYVFQKPEIKQKLDEIDPRLYSAYLGIMSINDLFYFTMEQMIELMSQTGNGVAGKVELDPDDEDEDEGGDEEQDEDQTVIKAQGLIFPILCHEIIKGLEEAKGRYGLPEDPSMREKVKGAVDILPNEPMQLRIGPEIVEKLRLTLPDEMFEPENKGLINWFQILLYQIPAKEFLEIIGDVISEDESKNRRATSKFREIMRDAQQNKKEYDEFQPQTKTSKFNDFGDEDDDEDYGDMDTFLGDLGIPRS